MNKIAFIGIILLLHACYSPEREEKNIRRVLQLQAENWNHGNMEAYMEGYFRSDSLVFIGKNGPKYGWETTLANYKKSYPDTETMGKLRFEIVRIERLSSVSAFVIGKWMLKRQKDQPSGYFTLLMKKIKGDWKIVADHSS